MSWQLGIFTFIVVWWLVIFAVLPWGIKTPQEPNALHDPGAPENPRLMIKFIITTILALVITFGIAWLMQSNLIQLRGMK